MLWARKTLPALVASTLLLAGCATQAPYAPKAIEAPSSWSARQAPATATQSASDSWWTQLHDPAIDALATAVLADNPTLEQALARMDEAGANVGINAAQRLPTISANGATTRARSLSTGLSGPTPNTSTTSSVGLNASWEIDLFGRVRSSVESAQRRLEARTADAQGTRLSLAAQVADTVLALRACNFSVAVQADDIASRETTLALTRRRLSAGFVAPVEESRAISSLASARTGITTQRETCERNVNALVALSGQDRDAVRALIATPPSGTIVSAAREQFMVMPTAPVSQLALPAQVLARQPSVVAAERDVAAAWADIAVARAERLPKLDLSAMLAGQWLRAAGSTLDYTAWSLGASLAGPLFDGGRGAANVDAADARYRAALAALRVALRNAAQDVENALAAIASADTRLTTTRDSVEAATNTFSAIDSQWRAGSVSLFELEDARRQLASARDSAINASRDSGQAWINLVRATGNAAITTESTLP